MLSPRSAEHYMNEADRCRALAAAMKEPTARRLVEHVARTYDVLAGKVAGLEPASALPAKPK